jgi:ubiquinone/menaquinone biosynthesis C-methylase UbiE
MNHSKNESKHDICPMRLAGVLASPLRRLLHKPEKILAGLVQPGQTVADFGCGPGYFTLQLARQVGPSGKVYAVDLQSDMLAIVRKNAEAAGLQDQIVFQQAQPEGTGLSIPLDFALTFWMVHEVPDRKAFLSEIVRLLKPGGHLLLVEPRLHVMDKHFAETLVIAESTDLQQVRPINVAISRAILFRKYGKI